MKIRNRLLSAMMGGIIAMGAALPVADAAKIDAYRNMILGKSYTIKYENITPPPRVTNRDRMDLFGKSGMSVDKNDYLTNRPRNGIIVSDGVDRYEEVGDGLMNQCQLTKGKDVFNFTKYKKSEKDLKYEYFGTGRNKVEANSKNYLAEIYSGQSFGDEDVSRILNAMLPADKKSANMTNYTYAAGGSLPDGLTYEDYKGSLGGATSVIRYYFKGASLVKIAAADFRREPDGSIEGHRCILRITEFSSAPERQFLSLPEGVKDVTKRKKEGKQ